MKSKTGGWQSNVGGSEINWSYAKEGIVKGSMQQRLAGPLWAVDFVRDEANKPYAIDFNMCSGLSDLPFEIKVGAFGLNLSMLDPIQRWFEELDSPTGK
jgi:hypothetical protein